MRKNIIDDKITILYIKYHIYSWVVNNNKLCWKNIYLYIVKNTKGKKDKKIFNKLVDISFLLIINIKQDILDHNYKNILCYKNIFNYIINLVLFNDSNNNNWIKIFRTFIKN